MEREPGRQGGPVSGKAVSRPAPEGWRLPATYPNVLLVGNDSAVDDALRWFRPQCRHPLVTCTAKHGPARRSLPSSGTVVLRDIGEFTLDGQAALLRWLSSTHGGLQVISTSAEPLWPHLQQGRFLETLYYRLNTLYFDLRRQPPRD
jgi:hypothetical protein